MQFKKFRNGYDSLKNNNKQKCFKSQRDAETTFNEFVASRTSEFYLTGITKLVSRYQKCINCINCNGLY